MSVVVLIPVGGDDPHRRRALSLVFDYYHDCFPDWSVIRVRGCDTNKGEALNAAVDLLDEETLIVLNDGDSLTLPSHVEKAATLAREEPGLVFAYRRYRRVDQDTTTIHCRHWTDVLNVRDDQIEWEKIDSGSHGCIAIRRACWEQVGGLDTAFATNGYEDLAFNTICEAFWPSRRVSGDLFHLWHPRGWDRDAASEATNRARYNRYLERWGDREALLELRHETVTA